jgi:hypothetical protein
MAHRCYLFITIALGESILVIGSQFGELARASSIVAAFVIAFVSSVAFWWIYFDRSAEAGIEVIATATDPGRLGVTAPLRGDDRGRRGSVFQLPNAHSGSRRRGKPPAEQAAHALAAVIG